MRPPPKKVAAYACAICRKVHRTKSEAAECCTCTTPGCGGTPAYLGKRMPCPRCCTIETFKSAKRHLEDAQNHYDTMVRRVKLIGLKPEELV